MRLFPVDDPDRVLPDPNLFSPMFEYCSPGVLSRGGPSAGTTQHPGGRFLAFHHGINAVNGWFPSQSAAAYNRWALVPAKVVTTATFQAATSSAESLLPGATTWISEVAEPFFNVFAHSKIVAQDERESFFRWICDMTRFNDYMFVVVHPLYARQPQHEQQKYNDSDSFKETEADAVAQSWTARRADRKQRRNGRKERATLKQPSPASKPCGSLVVLYANDARFVETVARGSDEDMFIATAAFARWNDFIHRGLYQSGNGFSLLTEPPDVLKDVPLSVPLHLRDDVRFKMTLFDFQSRTVGWMKALEDDESENRFLRLKHQKRQWLRTIHTNVNYDPNENQLVVGQSNNRFAEQLHGGEFQLRRQVLPQSVLAEPVPTPDSSSQQHNWPSLFSRRDEGMPTGGGGGAGAMTGATGAATATTMSNYEEQLWMQREARVRRRRTNYQRYSQEERWFGDSVEDDDDDDDYVAAGDGDGAGTSVAVAVSSATESSTLYRPLDSYRQSLTKNKIESRGGIICDVTGTGKTIETIAAIALQNTCNAQRLLVNATAPEALDYCGVSRSRLPPLRVCKEMLAKHEEEFYYCAATLVICPKHVCRQWADQFDKASGMKNAARVLVISCFQDAKRVSLTDVLRHYDLIVMNKEIAANQNYRTVRAQWSEAVEQRLGWTAARYAATIMPRFCAGERCYDVKIDYDQDRMSSSNAALRALLQLNREATRAAPDLVPPGSFFVNGFNAGLCYYARLIVDEIHELDAAWRLTERFVCSIRSDARWGLTATPAFSSAVTFGASAPGGYLALMRIDERRRTMFRRPCNRWQFVQHFTRRSGFVRKPRLTIERVDVQMTPQEMALYQSLDRVEARTLLEFCCHHDISNDAWLRRFLPERVYRRHVGGGGGDDDDDEASHIAPHTVQEVAQAMQSARLKRITTLKESTAALLGRWQAGEAQFLAMIGSFMPKRIVDRYRSTCWWLPPMPLPEVQQAAEATATTTTKPDGVAKRNGLKRGLPSSQTENDSDDDSETLAAALVEDVSSPPLQQQQQQQQQPQQQQQAPQQQIEKKPATVEEIHEKNRIAVRRAVLVYFENQKHKRVKKPFSLTTGATSTSSTMGTATAATTAATRAGATSSTSSSTGAAAAAATVGAGRGGTASSTTSLTAPLRADTRYDSVLHSKVETLFARQSQDRRQLDEDLQSMNMIERQYRYYETVFELLNNDSDIDCPICLGAIPRFETVLTNCGHQFCMDCLDADNRDQVRSERLRMQQDVARGRPITNPLTIRCATCRSRLHVWNDLKIIDRTATNNSKKAASPKEEASKATTSESVEKKTTPAEQERVQNYSRFGSKIQATIEHLWRITALPDAKKIVLFAQSYHLLHLVGDAMCTFGVPFVYVEGRNAQRNIDRFRNDESIRVILLSSETQHSRSTISGLDLIEANYVIAMQPPLGTDEECYTTMQQAIGRVVRQGQTSDCHLLVMVTRNTIEESLYDQWRQYATRVDRERGETQ